MISKIAAALFGATMLTTAVNADSYQTADLDSYFGEYSPDHEINRIIQDIDDNLKTILNSFYKIEEENGLDSEIGKQFYNDFYIGYHELTLDFLIPSLDSPLRIPPDGQALDICPSIELHRKFSDYFEGLINFANGRYDLGPYEANIMQNIEDGISSMQQLNDESLKEALENNKTLPCLAMS